MTCMRATSKRSNSSPLASVEEKNDLTDAFIFLLTMVNDDDPAAMCVSFLPFLSLFRARVCFCSINAGRHATINRRRRRLECSLKGTDEHLSGTVSLGHVTTMEEVNQACVLILIMRGTPGIREVRDAVIPLLADPYRKLPAEKRINLELPCSATRDTEVHFRRCSISMSKKKECSCTTETSGPAKNCTEAKKQKNQHTHTGNRLSSEIK